MQNINLYQPLRPSGDARRSRQMLLVALLALLLALGHSLWLGLQLWRGAAALQRAEQAAAQAEQQLQAERVGFVEPQLDPQLPIELAAREAENRQLRRLLDYLQRLERQQGFQAPLQALAERHPPSGLWLTRIALQDGGRQLRLDGLTQDQQLLAPYLHSLGQSDSLRGREFARFDLQRESSGLLQFRLSSTAELAEVPDE